MYFHSRRLSFSHIALRFAAVCGRAICRTFLGDQVLSIASLSTPNTFLGRVGLEALPVAVTGFVPPGAVPFAHLLLDDTATVLAE